MQGNFWKKLKRPIMVLAPMLGVTDAAFRRMLLKYGRPDVFWTEFVSVDGLFSRGRKNLLPYLKFLPAEHPIVAQIFGADPDLFEKAAAMIKDLGFDGIDINMGCPDRDVVKQGAGAALIENYGLAKQIIRATKGGAGKLPVSVKTRIGSSENQTTEWLKILLKEDFAALTVHFRAKDEAFGVPAHWKSVKKIIKLRDRFAPETLVFGNGDVESLTQARHLAKKTGLDGIMIGRAVLENPWFFSQRLPDVRERLDSIIEHTEVFEKVGNPKNFGSLKKYFKRYATGFSGAKDLRDCLMKTKSTNEVRKIVQSFRKTETYIILDSSSVRV